MKKILIFTLCAFSLIANAKTIDIQKTAGLQNGTFLISCTYGDGSMGNVFQEDGQVTPPMAPAFYLLDDAVSNVNDILSNPVNLNGMQLTVAMTCSNGAQSSKVFHQSDLMGTGTITIPAPCA